MQTHPSNIQRESEVVRDNSDQLPGEVHQRVIGETLESWRYSMTWKFSMDLVNFRFSFSRFKIFIGTFLSFIKKKNSDPSCFFYYTGKKAKSTEKFRKKGNLEIMLSIFQRSDKIKFRKRKQYGQRRSLL